MLSKVTLGLHYIGSAGVLYAICYIIVDLMTKRKLAAEDIVSRLVLLVLLFFVLLRT